MDDENNLEKLQRNLYSRDYKQEDRRRAGITKKTLSDDIQRDWKEEEKTKKNKRPEGFWIKWFLLIAVLFFLVSIGIATIVFLGGTANISSENVDVRILGPVSVAGGDELALDIIVDNKNNTTIETATVFVEYPEGARYADSLDTELVRDQQTYGTLAPGETVRKTFTSVLFGEQDSVQTIDIRVEYRVTGSSATFTKEKDYEVQISSSPVIMNINYPTEVSSNQETEFSVDIISNSSTELTDLLLTVDYPFGFSFVSANTDPSFDTNKWVIDSLEPEERTTITIQGVLQGQDNEERTFRFNIGTQKEGTDEELGAVFVASQKTVGIAKTGIGVGIQVNGDSSGDTVIHTGETVKTVISWINNLPDRIVDGSIDVLLSGNLFDTNKVSVRNSGFYQSATKSISWSGVGVDNLQEIRVGDRNNVSFDAETLALTSALASQLRNPALHIQVKVAGTRFANENLPEEIQTITSKTIKVASDLDLSARALYSTGPIENSGPIPPKVGEATTYTIVWSLTNSFNNVSDTKVTAKLPAYMNWNGITTPNSEEVTYDEASRRITWNVGTIKAGSGYNNTLRQVAFRVSLIPSASQVGDRPVLVEETTATGRDTFTNTTLTDTVREQTTQISTDPIYTTTSAQVVQ